MPIRPENKARYPKDWKAIRQRILNRSAHSYEPPEGAMAWPQCELCGVPNHMWIERTADGYAPTLQDLDDAVYIVLTIAHLSDEVEDCSDENLRAWCQRCHLRYDAPRKHREMAARRRAERASGDLFQCEDVTR